MSALRVGAMFAGYGGLEMGLSRALDVEPAWFAEFDTAPSRILAHHWPDVPNLGDVTTVDWTSVEPVDVITGGSPCQDLSHAGKRAGMAAGTRSGLWWAMREAVRTIRPRLVLWENVRGALSAPADSSMVPCPGCVGSPDDGPVLRALGRVLGDLANLGYDAAWHGLRAADVGAPHGRWRVFVLAWPAADTGRLLGQSGWAAGPGKTQGRGAFDQPPGRDLRARERVRDQLDSVVGERLTLLPTPAVNDMGAAYTPDTWDEWTARMKAAHGNGNGHGASLHIEALRMLPTPSVADAMGGHERRGGARSGELLLKGIAKYELLPTPVVTDAKGARNATSGRREGSDHHAGTTLGDVAHAATWGAYAPAIARWEPIIGRPAPPPTEPRGRGGAHHLSPRFVEWLMGLPDGHVVDVPGVTANQALKALGNGVVPQQAAAAVTRLLEVRDYAMGAAA